MVASGGLGRNCHRQCDTTVGVIRELRLFHRHGACQLLSNLSANLVPKQGFEP